MSVSDLHTSGMDEARTMSDGAVDDWADRSRRVLTRDLLVRAGHAQPGERRALQFRALHLNLPLVGEVAERLGLTGPERRRVEHHALNGLHEAIQHYDPYGDPDLAEFAETFIEAQMRSHLPRTALTVVGSRL
jgi:hypothetical protein